MPGTISKIDKWIDRSVPDYYILFVQAWIPFNAWFMTNFYSEDDKRVHDRDIIYYIMTKGNLFRDRIHALLRNDNEESIDFRERVAQLSESLDRYPFPSIENRLSFSRVCIENNPNARQTGTVKVGRRYTCTSRFDETRPKTAARWILEVVKNSGTQTQGIIELHKCLDSELAQNHFYQSCDESIKNGLRACLNVINPEMVSSVQHEKNHAVKPPHDSIVMSQKQCVYFVNNVDYVARAIIRILYELRCKLFHGEIEPSDGNSQIYEHAFHIQRILNKSIA